MAALQQTPIAFQPKSSLSSTTTTLRTAPRTLSFSFSTSTTFPSLTLTLPSRLRRSSSSAGGARMMAASAAGSYAVALADVAKSNNTLDATSSDVEKIEKLFAEPNVLEFFTNPTIDEEKKKKVVEEVVSSSGLQPHTANFLNILVEAKRIDLINDIVKEFETVYNRLTETELAIVSSVVTLESQHLAQIAKQVQKLTGAKNVRIKTVIDPSLVAGFTVRYGNSGSKLIDLSVKKQLEEIAAQLDLGDIKLSL
ncbi:ATP synthase delta chain, chloroplastic [Ziziphus jujuba]|uniref:ATP synthase delta chain, chloroplastic n=1 Tax=Ziziphus jujuba TaxID=326968 RepID=A0ABM3IM03_ZIZJJ|nr:ATP synthase delta chain, chloroplastic [Ziziphus jujuba]